MLAILILALLTLSDDSAALNAAIGRGNAIVQLEARDYGIGATLDGSKANVALRGVPGATRFIKLDAPSYDGIVSPDGGRTYRGWTFEGIEFAGNRQGLKKVPGVHLPTAFVSGSRRVRFERCVFRDLVGSLTVRDSQDVAFHDCEFFGTSAGVFQEGVFDPPAVADASLGSGISIAESCRDVAITRCRFQFCETGIGATSSSNLRVEDCDFRGDWWDNPSAVLRFTPTRTKDGRITLATGGFAAFQPGQVISFRHQVASGSAFASLYAGQVQAEGNPFANAAIGDVVETADGFRARVTAIASPSLARVEGWESIATYEPADPKTLAIPWRLSRYYACGIASVESDTSLTIYSEPVNMFTGERIASDAKLDPAKLPARVLARTIYSGLHADGGVDGLLVEGCRFAGSWADQCSVTNLRSGARIANNSFRHGQDEGVTLTNCPRSVVTGNEFVNCGVSAAFLGSSDFTTFSGNTIQNWGLVNVNGPAVDGYGGKGYTVTGNTFTASPSPPRDWCRVVMGFQAEDCTGSVFAGNTDGRATVATLTADLRAAPVANAIAARDVKTVAGPGAKNVASSPETPAVPSAPGTLRAKDLVLTGSIDFGDGRKWTPQGLFMDANSYWTPDGLYPGPNRGIKWKGSGTLIPGPDESFRFVGWEERPLGSGNRRQGWIVAPLKGNK